MKTGRTIIFTSCIALFLFFAIVCGTLFYFIAQPSSLKSLIERSFSHATGSSLTIQELSYSLNPFMVRAEEIVFSPGDDLTNFYVEISDVSADMAFQGPFGSKNLTFKKLKIDRFSVKTTQDFRLPEVERTSKRPSFIDHVKRTFVSFFLFRGITFQSAEISNGKIETKIGDKILLVSDILGTYGPAKMAEISCNIQFSTKQEPKEAASLRIMLKTGVLDLRKNYLNASPLKLTLKDIAEVNGTLNVRFEDSPVVSLDIRDSHFIPNNLVPFLGGKMKEQLNPVSLLGPVNLKGEILALHVQNTWGFHCKLNTKLDQNKFKYFMGKAQLRGVLSGDIDLEGEYPEIGISAKMHMNEANVASGNINLPLSSLSLKLTGKQPFFEIESLRAKIPRATLKIAGKNIFVNDIRVGFQNGKMDLNRMMVLVPDIRIDSDLLKNFLVSLSLDEEKLLVEFKGDKTNLVESGVAMHVLPSGWQFGALDKIQMSIRQKEKRVYSLTSRIELKELHFENLDSSCVGENISMRAKMDADIDLSNGSIGGGIDIQIQQGEVLYDRFYLNLAENGFIATSTDMRYDITNALLQIPKLELILEDILRLKADGSLIRDHGNQQLQVSVNLPTTDMTPIYRHFVLEAFQMENPAIKELNLSGMISADLEAKGSWPKLSALGHLYWHKGKISTGDEGLSAEGIDLDFPIWYQAEKIHSTHESLKGKISIDSMSFPSIINQPLAVDLEADHEKLRVKTPMVIKLPGGDIKIGPITARNIFSSQPSIKTALATDNFDINPLLSKIWPKPVRGTINGILEPLVLEGDTLTSNGNIEVGFFDGKVILADLGATGIFTAAPILKFNTKIEDLSLEEITAGTPFGKIEGILKGHINDLEIAYGQPQRFNLLLETREKKGVSQKVSLRAVDNIASIGGTQSPFMGMAGRFASLFEDFRYRKIGIRATLRNDVFRINGTIKEKGTEYIMQRGGIPGVSIINHNPENQVSFKDMIKRIKRIQSTEVKRPSMPGGENDS